MTEGSNPKLKCMGLFNRDAAIVNRYMQDGVMQTIVVMDNFKKLAQNLPRENSLVKATRYIAFLT